MRRNGTIEGIHTAAELDAHLRAAEAFIAGDDPASRLSARLEDLVRLGGLQALSVPERHWHACDRLVGSLFNAATEEVFAGESMAFRESVSEGLQAIGLPELARLFDEVARRHANGEFSEQRLDETQEELSELDEALSPFIDHCQEIWERMDRYAAEHGILGSIGINMKTTCNDSPLK